MEYAFAELERDPFPTFDYLWRTAPTRPPKRASRKGAGLNSGTAEKPVPLFKPALIKNRADTVRFTLPQITRDSHLYYRMGNKLLKNLILVSLAICLSVYSFDSFSQGNTAQPNSESDSSEVVKTINKFVEAFTTLNWEAFTHCLDFVATGLY